MPQPLFGGCSRFVPDVVSPFTHSYSLLTFLFVMSTARLHIPYAPVGMRCTRRRADEIELAATHASARGRTVFERYADVLKHADLYFVNGDLSKVSQVTHWGDTARVVRG